MENFGNLLFVIVLASFATTSIAIKCYQCSSTDTKDPFQCNEWLTSDIDITADGCDNVYGAQYCIKHVGRFEGGIGTKRFCSSLDLGNYCNYVKQPGDILTYRTCIYTCSGDGCNSSKSLRNANFLTCLLLAISLKHYFV